MPLSVPLRRCRYVDSDKRNVTWDGTARFSEGQKEKELKRIQSEAYQASQQIQGRADSLATQIYARSIGQDPEFYSFVKTLESYATSLKGTSTLLLSTDAEYLTYLKDLKPTR